MAKEIRVHGVRLKEIDEEKVALAYLLLAKAIVAVDMQSGEIPTEAAPDDDDEVTA